MRERFWFVGTFVLGYIFFVIVFYIFFSLTGGYLTYITNFLSFICSALWVSYYLAKKSRVLDEQINQIGLLLGLTALFLPFFVTLLSFLLLGYRPTDIAGWFGYITDQIWTAVFVFMIVKLSLQRKFFWTKKKSAN